jgi:hypothetical protein
MNHQEKAIRVETTIAQKNRLFETNSISDKPIESGPPVPGQVPDPKALHSANQSVSLFCLRVPYSFRL